MNRTVTAHLFSSLNGVSESPHLFQFDAFGEEEGELMDRSLAGVTDVVMGRRLWQEWSEYWPTASDGYGEFINPVRKHVIASALPEELGWNSRLVDGDPILVLSLLLEWGYDYLPATPPLYNDGVISVITG